MGCITCVEVMEQIDQRIRDNWRINTDETASEMSNESMGKIVA
jgi:hypothetical protein